MRLVEVTSAALAQQFLDVPTRLHAAVPQYIGPLYNEIEAVFDPTKNNKFKNGEAIRWVLLDAADRPIGRIAAFLNRDSPDTQSADLPVGGVGFFECIDNQQAANLLLDAGREWLAQRGMQAMDGPINFGDRDRFWGVLIDGFDFPPNYGMFWHPPYYQQLLEGYGFQLYFKQLTCKLSAFHAFHHSFAKRAQELDQEGYIFKYASKNDLKKLAQDFHHVYNLAWGGHAGVKPMSLDQARKLMQQMKPVMDERLLWFTYHNGEAVAFFLALPELNQIFKHVGRRLNLLGKLRFLWEKWKFMRQPDKKALGIIYGVVPHEQGKGVDVAMVTRTQITYQQSGYAGIEMNWIGDFNPKMMATVRAIGGRVLKTHATYRFLFDREREFQRHPVIR